MGWSYERNYFRSRMVIKPIWFLVLNMKFQHDSHLSTFYNIMTSETFLSVLINLSEATK